MYVDLAIAHREHAETLTLSHFARYELEFWIANLRSVNGAPIRDPVHSVWLKVDAGEHGFGAHTELREIHEPMPVELIKTSSTKRELYALIRSASQFANELRGRHVLVMLDSFAAILNLIRGGGPVAELSMMMKQWTEWCLAHSVTCTYKWIRLEENNTADRLSKVLDRQWQLTMPAG